MGENSSSLGITESCKVAAELLPAAALWCLWTLLIFPVIAVSHAALYCLTHMYVCLNSYCDSQTEQLFETLLIIKRWRFWMKLKTRWGLNLILHWRPPFHCWNLCMHRFQAIQTIPPFHLFCSNVLSCNSFRRLKPCVSVLAQKVFCRPPESVCMDSQIWGRLKKNAEQHRNVGSQKYVQTHFYGLFECPLWDRSWGFSRLMQTLFWYYRTEGLSLLCVLVCVTSCARANRHCLLNPAMNEEILFEVFLQSCSREFLLL